MSNKYQLLKDLDALYRSGAITEEEYQNERKKLMDEEPIQDEDRKSGLGMEENSYLMLMHLSQLTNFFIPFLGFAAPIIMWAVNKDKNKNVDRHGKNILNFIISWTIYYCISFVLCLILIGIPMLILLALLHIIFLIIAAVKANGGEFWKYPMSIPFIRID